MLPLSSIWLRLGFLLATLFLLAWASRADALTVDEDFTNVGFDTPIRYLRDGEANLQLADVQSKAASTWAAFHGMVPAFGFDLAPYWIRETLHNTSTRSRTLLLEIDNPLLDSVQVHLLRDGHSEWFDLGDNLPFASRPIHHHNFVVPVRLAAGEQVQIFLRIQTESSVQLPLQVWDRDQFFEHQHGLLVGQGLYFGIMLVMAVYNLFLFFTVRHRSYIFYSAYVLGLVWFIATLQGFGFQYLWPDHPEFNPHFISVSLSLFAFCGSAFTISLLRLQVNSPRHWRLFQVLAAISLIMLVAAFFLPYRLSIQPVVATGIAIALTGLSAGIYTLTRRVRPARYYVAAYAALFLVCTLLALGKFGWVTQDLLTEHAIEFCSIVEVVMLSFALADRINDERNQKFIAQHQALDSEKRARAEHERYLQLQYSTHVEELQAQQKLFQAEAESRAKSEFLATMSHEIRTPMNGMLGLTELLQDTVLSSQQRHYLNLIDGSGKALLNIINDILDYSKITAGKLMLETIELDLDKLCHDCTAVFSATAERRNIDLRCVLEPGTPQRIKGDPTRLRQVLMNLLGNAFKFTLQGQVELRVARLTDTGEHPQLRFSVIDTGIGISDDNQEHLFEAFSQADSSTTRQYGGTGLGLSISKQLVSLMGGEIGVVSQLDAGSTFWFRVPCHSTDSVAVTRAAAPSAPTRICRSPEPDNRPLRNRRVLVVEDNPVNQIVISGMLKKLGITSAIVANGEQALERLRQQQAEYDLVLMDCEMPVMDGYTATQAWRQHEKASGLRKPIIALTAHVLPDHRARALEAGMDDHLGKPVDLRTLENKLLIYLNPAALETAIC